MYCWFCRQQQALPRDAAIEDITIRNRYLEERLHSLEGQLSKESPSRPSVGATLCMTNIFPFNTFHEFHSTNFIFTLSLKPYIYHTSIPSLIMKKKHVASPPKLSWSSKVVHSMTYDISEDEKTRSSLVNDTIPGKEAVPEKQTAVTEDKATQTSFKSVSQDEEKSQENVGQSAADVEQEDLVNENKSEQEEDNIKEGLVEKDIEEPDETQGGQEEDIVVAEHAQE